MKLIIKQPIDKKEWATVFCVGDNACEIGGNISNTVLEKMRSEGFIQQLYPEKFPSGYSKHASLMQAEEAHIYYEINKKNPVVTPVACFPQKDYCYECRENITAIDKIIFSTNEKQLRQMYYGKHCPKCDLELASMTDIYRQPEMEEKQKEKFQASGLTWIEQ